MQAQLRIIASLAVIGFPVLALAGAGPGGAESQALWYCTATLMLAIINMAVPRQFFYIFVMRMEKGKRERWLEWLSKPEIIAPIWATIMMGVHFAKGGSTSHVIHSFETIDYKAATLVGALMFTSLLLKSFNINLLRAIQGLSGRDVDERKFAAISIVVFGFMSSILSEVAVAAAISTGVATVMAHQDDDAKKRMLVLLAAAIGVGGAFTNFAAPSIVIAARKFDWSTLQTMTYLGGFALVSLAVLAVFAWRWTKNSVNSDRLKKAKIRIRDWINLIIWGVVVYVGVFWETTDTTSIFGMLFLLAASMALNYAFIGLDVMRGLVDSSRHRVFHEINHYFLEAFLVFMFLFALMFMGEMIIEAIRMLGVLIPEDDLAGAGVLYAFSNFSSALADNALSVFALAGLAGQNLLWQIMIAWGSLTGGMMTIIGNAPNIVVWNLFGREAGVKVSFFKWVAIIFIPWLVIAAISVIGLIIVSFIA